ncbi:single-stranded DNA-binding protein [Nocardioides hwasunensis]|uniref:Single-stranded DNA-binding protein n=1 Tax=Nocardioides hwasunensis TaxID=397258 RepID=A0ABR8MNF1_9ACTN|nr:single-stranded DNA-binding protein [Nocardioides hwasunensis]MBD3917095.1 single-stranded DNA-binding protein [Nocardioides hwasunensis]
MAAGSGDREVLTNEVRLIGRLSADPGVIELPSGDELMSFRISVPRRVPTRGSGVGQPQTQRVDSIPCVAWAPRLRRSVATWRAGDVVEVEGAMRCRFYQAGGATRSRVEVEVAAARVIRRRSAA